MNNPSVGKMFVVKEKFGVEHCCNTKFKVGEKLECFKQSSRNRVWIRQENNWCHKVKLSTLKRCSEVVK